MKIWTWTELKSQIISKNNTLLFSIVEISLTNFCNRSCSFCPVDVPDKITEINIITILKIVEELNRLNFKGLICLSGYCEPTLHPYLNDIINIIRYELPECILSLHTNGDFISRLKQYDVDYTVVSLYEEERLEEFEKLDVIINKRYEEGNMILSNRAGAMPTEKILPLKEKCLYPFYMIYIDYNGDVLYCSHNFHKKNILGNINNKSLFEMWNGNKINDIRDSLSQNNRNFSPCNMCDVNGSVMGENSYETWKQSRIPKNN